MQLTDILTKYAVIEAQLTYSKAVELLKLISDEELEKIYTDHSDLFIKLTNPGLSHDELLENKESIDEAIEIFISTIESRKLSKDEYDAMTLDDIRDYVSVTITKKAPLLLDLIHAIECEMMQ